MSIGQQRESHPTFCKEKGKASNLAIDPAISVPLIQYENFNFFSVIMNAIDSGPTNFMSIGSLIGDTWCFPGSFCITAPARDKLCRISGLS